VEKLGCGHSRGRPLARIGGALEEVRQSRITQVEQLGQGSEQRRVTQTRSRYRCQQALAQQLRRST
jgi:hypothetical protein